MVLVILYDDVMVFFVLYNVQEYVWLYLYVVMVIDTIVGYVFYVMLVLEYDVEMRWDRNVDLHVQVVLND